MVRLTHLAHTMKTACRPKGRLHVAIEVTWMQNRAPDMDALTELSRMSLGPSLPSSSTIPDQVRLSTGPPAEIHVPPSGIRHVSGSCFGRAPP